jgi:hypothetical protein
VRSVSQIDETVDVRKMLHSGQGPIFIDAKIKADDPPRVIPSRDGQAIKQRFIEASAKQL